MNLQAGQRLGPYEVISFIGAGAMGEVYRARDTRLERTVALKILPPGLSTKDVLRARFEREARAIAALSHPNICAIHDVGTDDGTEYLVMEYLDGETLADRIARGPLPMQQVLRYGVQIAEALQQAHRAGITHRDLKPGNIMITAAGAKLLDFGLAKTIHEAGLRLDHDAPTQIAPLTYEGAIVGTFQYMSPEQIEGRSVDHRTDIFALGVILYEMTTGRRPFDGGSPSAIAAAILASDPSPVRTVQPNAPPALERIIATALEKDADDRWQTAQDVARQLRWLTESSSSAAEPAGRVPSVRRAWPLALIVVLAMLATWVVMTLLRRKPDDARSVARLEISTPPGVIIQPGTDVNALAVSPDGRSICFVAMAGSERALYLRDLSSYGARKIDGSEGAVGPFWSPDGEWIGFSARGKLYKTKRSGDSPPRALCDVAIGGATGSWSDGMILFADAPDGRHSIFRVSAEGGEAVAITKPVGSEWRHTWPYVLPGGRHFVYLAFSSRANDRELVLATIDGTKKAVLLKNISAVRAPSEDQLMYVRDGKLLAQRLAADDGKLVGDPVTVADNVSYFYATARADFEAVPSGVIVYRTDTRRGRVSIVDRSGVETKLVDGEGKFFDASLSPDATKAAITVIDPGTALGDIWLYDLQRGVRDRFTSDSGMEFSPVWSPDGRWIYHSSAQGGSVPFIVRRGVGGSAFTNVTAPGAFRYAESVSRDGQTLYFVDRNARTKTDIYRLRIDGGGPEALFASLFVEEDPEVSPDGKWLAYTSDSTGSREVYVESLAGAGSGRIRVSRDGGAAPKWRGDGTELFYLSNSRRAVSVVRSASGDWNDARADSLFTRPAAILDHAPFPDGRSFLLVESTPGARDALVHVILGWRE